MMFIIYILWAFICFFFLQYKQSFWKRMDSVPICPNKIHPK